MTQIRNYIGQSLQIFRHELDLIELVVCRKPKKRTGICERRFTADIERPIATPEPEVIGLGVVYTYRPGMEVTAPAVQEVCGLFVIAETLEVGYVVRFIGGDVTAFIDAHDLSSNATGRNCLVGRCFVAHSRALIPISPETEEKFRRATDFHA